MPGTLRYQRSDTIVLTIEEYRRAYESGPWRWLFEYLWMSTHLVFVGFGFRDPFLDFITGEVIAQTAEQSATGGRHIAFIGLNDHQPYSEEHRRFFLQNYNVRPIFYPATIHDHSGLLTLLDNLAYKAPLPTRRRLTSRPQRGGPSLLYMAYGEIGCFCLNKLLTAGIDVVGVFCRTSDRTDRDDIPSVYTAARRAGLHVFTATDPNDPAFLDEARRIAPDLLLSIQYDRILKPPLLAIPHHGAYNLHFGPLPRLRGCFPTKWAIIEDEPAGVTFHCIDSGIDSGDILAQTIVPVTPDETDHTLYCKLQETGKRLFEEQIPWMKMLAPPPRQPQDPAEASYHPKRLPYDGVIDWSHDAAWVERFIRAFTFPPYPAAKTWLGGKEVEVRAPVEIGSDLPGCLPGEMELKKDGAVAVQCGRGSLSFRRVLVEGQERLVTEVLGPSL